jgi:hypothetical protein
MYYDYLEHAKYGKLGYGIRLRNINELGKTFQENLAFGPCCEITLIDYHQASWGKSPQEAIARMHQILDIMSKYDRKLSPRQKRSCWKKLKTWWGMRKINKICDPVTRDKIKSLTNE